MKRWMLGLALVASASMLAGCGKSGEVEMVLRDMSFSKKEITFKQGETSRLTLNNRDKVVHDFNVDIIPVDVIALTINPESSHEHSSEREPDLHVSVEAGEKGWVEFIPLEAGTYTFYCTVDGHRMAGMEGTLIIK